MSIIWQMAFPEPIVHFVWTRRPSSVEKFLNFRKQVKYVKCKNKFKDAYKNIQLQRHLCTAAYR